MLEVKRIVAGPVMTNCYIAWNKESGEGFIVDPGDNAERIISAAEGIRIKYIFITHGHFDHILAAARVKEHTKAQVVVHKEDAECLTDPVKCLLGGFMNRTAGFEPTEADIVISGGEALECAGEKLKLIHTPGHSRGSYCIDTGEQLFTGDTLFEDDCGRCDLPGGSYKTILRSLKLLHDLEGDRTVYPGHDVTTTLERERSCNRNMLEALEILQ